MKHQEHFRICHNSAASNLNDLVGWIQTEGLLVVQFQTMRLMLLTEQQLKTRNLTEGEGQASTNSLDTGHPGMTVLGTTTRCAAGWLPTSMDWVQPTNCMADTCATGKVGDGMASALPLWWQGCRRLIYAQIISRKHHGPCLWGKQKSPRVCTHLISSRNSFQTKFGHWIGPAQKRESQTYLASLSTGRSINSPQANKPLHLCFVKLTNQDPLICFQKKSCQFY